MTESKSFNKHPAHKALYHALMKSLLADEEGMDQGVDDSLKKKRKHDDQDEDPLAGPNQGKKNKRRRTNESESSKKSSTSKGNTTPKTSKSENFVHVEELVAEPAEEVIMDAANDNMVNDADQPQDDSEPKTNRTPRNNWFTQPPRPPTPDPEWNKGKAVDDDWNNPEGDRFPFDLSKPLPLKVRPGHLTVASEYFFNNDLEYLKSSDPEKKYTTSITKIKAARYELVGIEDMIPNLWSVTKVGYDKDAILSVKSSTVNKLHGYGYLEEIMVRRADRQLYKFKEGDFINLQLNDIKDMLLLAVQHKLFLLDGEVIVDLAVALCMFTRSLIIKKRVEDVQVGVVYADLSNRKRLMRVDELYKFSDETLKNVRDTLHHMLLNFRFGYNKDMPFGQTQIRDDQALW
ncbi:hypothetical protein Tco_0033367 [Tanacetum coccineum]